MTAYGYIAEGYEYPMLKFTGDCRVGHFRKKKKEEKRRKTYEGRKIQSFSELKPGDYVVHENHGIGVYQGIEKIVVDKISKDYMKISYAQGGNLYIPATQLDLIQKYASADAKKPKLNKLGTQEWNRTKSQGARCRKRDCKRFGEAVCGKTGAGWLCLWRRYSMAERI